MSPPGQDTMLDMNMQSPKTIAVGSCELSLVHQQLKRAGRVIPLGGRAFNVLLCLIEKNGEVVTKRELISLVWPRREVDENTLEAAISSLRRALGPDRVAISTVAGRGYRFIESRRNEPVDLPTSGLVGLPATMSRLIGRNSALDQLMIVAGRSRLITLIGAGGIGKTRLAIELVRCISNGSYDRVGMAELAPVSRDECLPMTIASAVGFIPPDGQMSFERLAQFLQQKRTLLILDNCEHLIEASASLVDALLRSTPSLQLIATSREALRIEGEHIYQVSPLEVPGAADEDQQSISEYSAVQLLEARLSRGQVPHSSDAASALIKAKICRRLDGIPLAIELAAARVEVFGLTGVWEDLANAFDMLTGGSRTSLPRQRTLAATLSWSYDRLPVDEQTVLARLSVFSSQFSLEAAIAVVASLDIPPPEVLDCIVNLASKSLVSFVTHDAETSYRLLEMTRVYAQEKLSGNHEAKIILKRHAQYFLDLLQSAAENWHRPATHSYMTRVETYGEDLRAALHWCFMQPCSAVLGIKLTTALLPYWTERTLVSECRLNMTRAHEYLENCTVFDYPTATSAYKGYARLLSNNEVPREAERSAVRSSQFSDQLDDINPALAARWQLWAANHMTGIFQECGELARRVASLLSVRLHQRTFAPARYRVSR